MFPEATFWVDWGSFYAAYGQAFGVGSQRGREAAASLRALLDRRDPLLVASARCTLTVALVSSGDFDEAEREAKTLLESGFVLSAVRANAQGALALVALHRGQAADAFSAAERGLEAARSGVRFLSTESLLHLARAEALHALGRNPDALAAIREARDRILGIAATLEPNDRTSYLTNVNANARTLGLAKEWLGE